jgi:tRNA (guanine10-N2)-dimethyltransferase
VDRVLAVGPLPSILRAAARVELGDASFRVRAHGPFNPEEKRDLERRIGGVMPATGRVDLDAPERDFRLLRTEGGFLLGEVLVAVERSAMEARKVARRPFSMPISLHPKLARALVNLSRCPRDGRILDPFCGTGGIAIEAARLGMKVVASDLQEKMVRGTASVLDHYGLRGETFVADIGEVPRHVARVGAIATDPPYGRAASTRGESIASLYRRAFAAFREILPRGGFAAVALPSEEAVRIGEEFLELEEAHTLQVHRTLARTFAAFVRSR